MSQNLRDAEYYLKQGLDGEKLHSLLTGKKIESEKKLWEQVKLLEESHISDEQVKTKLFELDSFRATMIVNFGEEGRHTKGLVAESQNASQMMISVLEQFLPKN
jgi:hypothetical protein